jgi:class 3 adenylate cyclase
MIAKSPLDVAGMVSQVLGDGIMVLFGAPIAHDFT